MTAASVTRETVGQAIRQLRITHRDDSRKVTALNKAEARLYSALWQWHAASRTLVVESATKAGLVTYHVEAGHCDCPAHGPCWHIAAWEVLTTAETMRPRIKKFTAADLERIAREAAELV